MRSKNCLIMFPICSLYDALQVAWLDVPSLIPNFIARPRQLFLWNEHFDPWVVSDEDVSGRPDSVFFALRPPPQIASWAYQVGRDFRDKRGLRCSLVKPECLHLTMLGIGRYEELSRATIEAVCAAAATVAISPFLVGLNRAMSFDNKRNRPFVLAGDDRTIPGIAMLRQNLVLALCNGGLKRLRVLSFTPHMTLFRSRCNLGERDIDEIKWIARDFVLIHSLHGQGPHEVLSRWPVGAMPDLAGCRF
jgi:RNA 2',3'-cyclic 3'-phosphodiesterase